MRNTIKDYFYYTKLLAPIEARHNLKENIIANLQNARAFVLNNNFEQAQSVLGFVAHDLKELRL